jgi:hypothetical protein
MHRYIHKRNLSFRISFRSERESAGSQGTQKEKKSEEKETYTSRFMPA